MVSEGKEQAIEHLSKAELAFIAILLDLQGGLAEGDDQQGLWETFSLDFSPLCGKPNENYDDQPKNSYQLTFENIKVIRGHLNQTTDGTHFEYRQSPKGLKFKIENENDEQIKQAAEDDEVKEPKEGKTYGAILTDPEHIEVLVEIDPHDIAEIIHSARDKETVTV